MLQKSSITLSILVLGLLVLSACGSSEAPAPAPTNSPVPETTEVSSSAEIVEASEETTTAEPAEEPAEMAETTDEVRTFTIVPEESSASYIVKEEFFGGALNRLGISPGLVDTIGSTQEIEGELQLNLNDPSPLVSNHFTVNIRSLTSDQSRRDNQIRQRWLESNTFPLAEFTATAIEDGPQEYVEGEEVTFKLIGDMTIREITKPVTFDVTAILAGDTITGIATTGLAMTDFGFDPPNFANILSVENEFTVEVQFTFKEMKESSISIGETGMITYHTMAFEDNTTLQYAVALSDKFDPGQAYPILLALPPGPQTKDMVVAAKIDP